jgi:hypothetical protein
MLSREPFCTRCEVRGEPQARVGGLPQNQQRSPQVNPSSPIQEVRAQGQDIARQAVVGAEAVDTHDANRLQFHRANVNLQERGANFAELDRLFDVTADLLREIGIEVPPWRLYRSPHAHQAPNV